VPSAGRLLATGKGVSTGRGKAGKAGDVRVKVTLTKAEQAFLRKHPSRKLREKINLRFTPNKGAKLTTSVTLQGAHRGLAQAALVCSHSACSASATIL